MKHHSFLFLAAGFEEIEALTVVDVMRRAGMDVKTVSITASKEVCGAHGIKVVADTTFTETDFSDAEWLIIPGGMPGASNLASFEPLNDLLKAHAPDGKIAAICAAPAVVLAPLGILDGKEATCYPGFEDQCDKAVMRDVPIVVLDSLITANGPSAALPFALAIVASSLGANIAQQIGSGMLHYPKSVNFYF
ncbi:MAG: DJ-1/PfpI family protein [Muribaculaceae bacterium]|nr:DJ-1/PfpI family protein [Muribaculaceae bacterium]